MRDIPSNREKMEVWINDGDWVDPKDVIYVAPDYLMAFELYKKEYKARQDALLPDTSVRVIMGE